jgi:hypothetical protein
LGHRQWQASFTQEPHDVRGPSAFSAAASPRVSRPNGSSTTSRPAWSTWRAACPRTSAKGLKIPLTVTIP